MHAFDDSLYHSEKCSRPDFMDLHDQVALPPTHVARHAAARHLVDMADTRIAALSFCSRPSHNAADRLPKSQMHLVCWLPLIHHVSEKPREYRIRVAPTLFPHLFHGT